MVRSTRQIPGIGVVALLSTPALADAGWDEVAAVLSGAACLVLIIATMIAVLATRKTVTAIILVVVGVPSCRIAYEILEYPTLDVWTFFLVCFGVFVAACGYKLWRPRGARETAPPPPDVQV